MALDATLWGSRGQMLPATRERQTPAMMKTGAREPPSSKERKREREKYSSIRQLVLQKETARCDESDTGVLTADGLGRSGSGARASPGEDGGRCCSSQRARKGRVRSDPGRGPRRWHAARRPVLGLHVGHQRFPEGVLRTKGCERVKRAQHPRRPTPPPRPTLPPRPSPTPSPQSRLRPPRRPHPQRGLCPSCREQQGGLPVCLAGGRSTAWRRDLELRQHRKERGE